MTTDSETLETGGDSVLQPICRRLRTKMYYVVGRDHVDLRSSSPTAQYWCSQTATVMGPDDVYCSPEVCQPGRACFDPAD
ncbi:MAG: hypothetical protein AB7O37_06745 [Vicinamibacteria bacterium]